jgi:tRNA (guanine37-N1)-methyltransferase|tara:strand:- start:10801 stop:11409 length:609 start_codon:yes stop_codon:yes gene_type:complete
MFDSYLNESVLRRGILKKKIKIKFYNPRDFVKSKHKKVDQIPYGGGPGMVMMTEPIVKAVEKAKGKKKKVKTIIFSPSGKEFTNTYAKKIQNSYKDIILIAGRYEGIDKRVKTITKAEEISIGPYVLTGGELPAMIFIDAVSRQIKGVLGNELSVEENRISSSEVYTRPETIKYKGKKYKVPKVLLSGHHKNISQWKEKGRK